MAWDLNTFADMRRSLLSASASLLVLGLLALGCSSGADGEDPATDVSEGALIPTKAFSASCTVKMPNDDGTIGTARVTGKFKVSAKGNLSAADKTPIHVIQPDGSGTAITLKSGKVIDSENDKFEVAATYGMFEVSVKYDGSKKNKKNVVIEAPFKGTQTYDGVCKFKDDAEQDADGKVK